MRKAFISAALLAVATAAVPAIASAATITFSSSTSVTGRLVGGTSATFVDREAPLGTLTIRCTTHTIVANAANLSRRVSTNTSLLIRGENNTYSSSVGTAPPACDYTHTFFGSGSATVVVGRGCDWLLTAVDTRTAIVEILTNSCSTLEFTGGALAGCRIFVNRQTLTAGMMSDLRTATDRRTEVRLAVTNARVNYTAVTCGGSSFAGDYLLTETLVFSTAGISNN
jgi:hypothetical protein